MLNWPSALFLSILTLCAFLLAVAVIGKTGGDRG